jgi:hypothetical protein
MNINYLSGDATRPSGQGRKIIAHICNDQGRWGVTWEYVQNVGFWAVSISKMCIWLLALVVVWLTLWARQLGKRSG